MSQDMNMNEKKTTFEQQQFNAEPTYGTFDQPVTTTTITTTTIITPDSEASKPGMLEKVKGAFVSNKDAKDSEYTEQKPGLLQGAKEMVWSGVEKAKGVFTTTKTEAHPGNGYHWRKSTNAEGKSCWVAADDFSTDSANRGGFLEGAKGMVRSGVEKAKGVFTTKTEAHPGNGYHWRKTTTEQGTRWVAYDDFSSDSANGGGFLEGAKGMVRSGVEKAKGVFTSNKEAKECESKECEMTAEDQKPSAFQGAKDAVWQGVEKVKGMFTTTPEQHPGKGYTWKKVEGRWVATNDWSSQGVFQTAKGKVMQGVEKTKGVFSSSKSTETHNELFTGKGYKWKKVEGQKDEDAHWKPKTAFQNLTDSLTGTH